MKYVYVLKDPITEKVRYVGATGDKEMRFHRHFSGDDSVNRGKDEWVKSLKLSGFLPILEVVEEVTDDAAREKEKEWIEKCRSKWLFNIQNNSELANKAWNLTSVKVNKELYKEFKLIGFDTEISFQSLVNKTLYLYNRDTKFRALIHDTFSTSGSAGL